ncbi:NAD-binding protein [Natronorarus salvus]|uniref:NAD-binding protein n=1 Tax=Natronorarus salvus TaxID=3117733 RepID=UPI002F268268
MGWLRRRGFSGTRLTVGLVSAVAVLSIGTGVANIGQEVFQTTLLDLDLVPRWIQQTAGFTGAMTGFLMLAGAYGLHSRLRIGWYMSIVLLPMTAFQGLVQSSPASVPLVLLSLLAIPNVWATRRAYRRSIDLTTAQIAAGLALVGSLAYGTFGTYALREEFDGVETLLDAFYFTLVTASTVGFGDATASPEAQGARLFALSVLLVGTSSFAVALGALLGPAIQARFTTALGKMTDTDLDSLDDHVLVLGYGDLTEPIVQDLDGRVPFVIVSRSDHEGLAERGYPRLRADPSEDDPLLRAGLERARAVVVATESDAQDALCILTARHLNPEVHIVSAATDRNNVAKLERAGADVVISPATIGGRLLARSALDGDDAEVAADHLLREL